MKRKSKIALGGLLSLFAVIALSSCTKSFCSNTDSARAMYAYEPGITEIGDGSENITFTEGEYSYTIQKAQFVTASFDPNTSSFYFYDDENGNTVVPSGNEDSLTKRSLTYLNQIISAGKEAGILTVTENQVAYFSKIDSYVFNAIFIEAAKNDKDTKNPVVDLSTEAGAAKLEDDMNRYAYLKYVANDSSTMYERFNEYDAKARTELTSDQCVSTDFKTIYASKMNSFISQYRTCLTTRTGKYGTYGYSDNGIYVTAKTWNDAWSKGFFEGLLVYPIGWLIDQIAFGFSGLGSAPAAMLSIFFVTLIVRGLMMLVTFKQTAGNAKMTELQPEITKIQNKYPNANTNKYEKQRMAEEINAIYKKNKINPLSTLLVLVVQFPVFICVWGALSGSAILTNGSIFGSLPLSWSIKDALFTAECWTAAGNYAAVTALFLFLLMAGAQTVSMLLPQWMQKAKAKQVARLGKNPSQKSQDNKMKWVTYIMLAMIIFMGFSLVSAMGVYWLIGAVISVAQTLITQAITSKKQKNKRS